jgi:hypothetical protein
VTFFNPEKKSKKLENTFDVKELDNRRRRMGDPYLAFESNGIALYSS